MPYCFPRSFASDRVTTASNNCGAQPAASITRPPPLPEARSGPATVRRTGLSPRLAILMPGPGRRYHHPGEGDEYSKARIGQEEYPRRKDAEQDPRDGGLQEAQARPV